MRGKVGEAQLVEVQTTDRLAVEADHAVGAVQWEFRPFFAQLEVGLALDARMDHRVLAFYFSLPARERAIATHIGFEFILIVFPHGEL